ncbi:MAG: substrate-binding domain-containing protein, partial [Anaerolineae bacterium]|nr:substrate-binding domain-containing protein [Anaerolineae bacterium]
MVGCGSTPTTEPQAEGTIEEPTSAEEAEPAEEVAPVEKEVVEEEAAAEPTEEAEATTETEAADTGSFTLNERIAEKVANGEPLMLRVSYHDVSNEFAPFIKQGVEQAATDFDVDVEMVGPVSPDADAQIAELENLVEAGVDGLAISSVSSDALAPIIDRLVAEGIPVVTYNTDNPESARLGFAGQDLVQSGYEAAKVLADLM